MRVVGDEVFRVRKRTIIDNLFLIDVCVLIDSTTKAIEDRVMVSMRLTPHSSKAMNKGRYYQNNSKEVKIINQQTLHHLLSFHSGPGSLTAFEN